MFTSTPKNASHFGNLLLIKWRRNYSVQGLSRIVLVQQSLNRNLLGVPQIWKDYSVSQGGNRSKRELEAEGSGWREHDRQFWHKRVSIFVEVERIAREEGMSLNDAAKALEARRTDKKVNITTLQLLTRRHKGQWMQHVAQPVAQPVPE